MRSPVWKTGDGGSKDTVISTGTYEAMEFGYWMEDGTTGEWQAITLDHTGFYWRDAELDRLTHFHQFAVYGVKILIFRYINNPPAFRQGDRFVYKENQNSSFFQCSCAAR